MINVSRAMQTPVNIEKRLISSWANKMNEYNVSLNLLIGTHLRVM